MPKSRDRKNKRKTCDASNNTTETDDSVAPTGPKRRKVKIPNRTSDEDGIAMSKQLAKRLQSSANVRRSKSTRSTKNCEPRLCGNGRPMPSLTELEKMFEDSDSDEDPGPVPVRCQTPENPKQEITADNLMSPRKLQELASIMLDIISIQATPPPSPIVPEKRQRSDTPYIVGCTVRKQVPWASKARIGKGSGDYGVKRNAESSEEENVMSSKKRQKRFPEGNISKSIFNAKADEIAARLNDSEKEELGNDSPDSNKTVAYELASTSPVRSRARSFSPLPSTSRDKETFLENDKRFTESILCDSLSSGSTQDVEVVEIPCDTIIIEDTLEREVPNVKPTTHLFDDDCCIIVESEVKKETNTLINIDSPKDEFYSTIDLSNSYDTDNEVCEVIDVDDVIAETTAIIKKHRNENNPDRVTTVEPSISYTSNRVEILGETSVQNLNSLAPAAPSFVNSSCQTVQLSNINCADENRTVTILDLDNSVTYNTQPRNSDAMETTNNSNKIAQVIGNYFNNINSPETYLNHINTPETSTRDTVDLTCAQDTCIDKITSWVSSIGSYLSCRNRPLESQGTVNDPPVLQSNINNTSQCTRPSFNNVIQMYNSNVHVVRPRPPTFIPNVISTPSVPIPPLAPPNPFSIITSTAQNQTPDRPIRPAREKTQGRSLGECPICMDSLADHAIASTLCGHIFCMKCIKTAFRANGKRCPTCRKALRGVGYHQLFL